MNNKNSTGIYRTLIREALHLTWQRKSLWIFGIFAAFVSTGGVLDVASSGMRRVALYGSLKERIVETCFANYVYITKYVGQFFAVGTFRSLALFFFLVLIVLGLLFLAVLSQTALIHGIKAESHERPNILRKRAHDHLWRVFGVNLLTKGVSTLVVVLTTLPLLFSITLPALYPFSFLYLQTLILFPSMLVISILSMLSIIHLIETECTIKESIKYTWNVFQKHWLATFEFSLILFVLTAFSCMLLLGVVILLNIPYALVYTASLLTGSMTIFIIANVFYGLFALAILLALGGAIVTFQYSAWYLFYQQSKNPLLKKLPIAKLLRMFQKT